MPYSLETLGHRIIAPRGPRLILYIAILAAFYFAAAKLGLTMAFAAEQVTVVWPPTGIALAAVILFGYRIWPGIALGAFLTNVTANEPAAVAASIAIGNTLEALSGAWLLRRFAQFDSSLARLRDVLSLIIFPATISTALSAMIGVTSLCLGGVHPWSFFGTLWPLWWLGDAAGCLIVAPALLVLGSQPAYERQRRRIMEAAALLLGLAAISAVVFMEPLKPSIINHSLVYIIFLFVIWAAFRFGQVGASIVTLIASGIAIWGTVHGLGPFAVDSIHQSLILLLVFMAVVAITGLLLSAAILERNAAVRRQLAAFAVSRILTASAATKDAVPQILQVICQYLRWDLGVFWNVDREAQVLRCVEIWHEPGLNVPEFEMATRTRTFERGVGLPGRVWENRKATWITNITKDKNFPRIAIAAKEGLYGAFGFPVVLGDRTLGVMEFFSQRIRQPDKDLLQMFAAVGSQIGQFMERKCAEEELRRSEQNLADFFDNAVVALHWLGPDGKILRVNQAELNMLGYSQEEYVGHSISEFHADPAAIQDILRRLKNGETLSNYPARLLARDGSIRHALIDSNVLWENNTFIHSRGFTRDITDHKRAEDALRKSQERLNLITNAVPALISYIDTGYRYRLANSTYQRWLNQSPEEIQGKHVREVLGDDSWHKIKPYMDRALAGEEVTYEQELTYHGVGLRSVLVTYTPDCDAVSGPVRGFVVLVNDLTEQKYAVETLRASERRFRTLTRFAPVGIFQTDAEGNCLFVNQRWCDMSGITAEDTKGQGWVNALHPEDRQRVLAEWYVAARAGNDFHSKYRFQTSQGIVTELQGSAIALREDDGTINGYIGTITDVTALKQAEEALKEADRRKDEFLAMLAHELRNPLAPLHNGLSIMRLIGVKNPKLLEAQELMERQLQQMTHLVDDLLDLSRITQGKIKLRKKVIDLSEAIRNAIDTSHPLIQSSGHRLEVEMLQEPVYVDADMTRLAQVFANLLSNAAKYTNPGGQIWLTVTLKNAQAVITIRDTGIGIASAMLPHIFNVFAQADNSLEFTQGGLGIGLTLVKGLTEMHNGTVEVKSEGEGAGSEFTVRLPLASADQRAEDKQDSVPSEKIIASRKVLVVDDNEASAKTLGWMLELMGQEVKLAHSGPAAIDMTRDFTPDVVLLDIGLPGMNGYEVCRKLRKEPMLRDTIFVAQTGWGQKEHRERSREAGFDYHLVKPIDMEALKQVFYL